MQSIILVCQHSKASLIIALICMPASSRTVVSPQEDPLQELADLQAKKNQLRLREEEEEAGVERRDDAAGLASIPRCWLCTVR